MKNGPRLWHVVPQFAPLDGVGDYALKLGGKLREYHGIESGYIVCWLPWKGPGEMSGFPVHQLATHQSGELRTLLADLHVEKALLHYVGYGYQKRGVPLWLAEALKHWKASNPQADVFTLFHELWSKGPPTSSVFYLSWLQKRLVAELHNLSLRSFTTIPRYREALEKITPGKTELTQIPSNLEVEATTSRHEKNGPPFRALVFGQTWSRTPAVRRHRAFLENLHSRKMLECVAVAGKSSKGGNSPSEDVALLREFLPGEKIQILGEVSRDAAGQAFAEADFFLCAYSGWEACKSTAMKCALAAGCPVILDDGSHCEPLVSGMHFQACDGSPAAVEQWLRDVAQGSLRATGAAARDWYETHATWPVAAAKFAEAFEAVKPAPISVAA